MTEQAPRRKKLARVRLLLWLLVGLAIIGTASVLLVRTGPTPRLRSGNEPTPSSFGGPFTLVGGNGKPFSSQALAGKPYAIYFGFTRCGDVCPTTLSRLVRLRRAAASDDAINILFVTIDPAHDGPREVGQYATLFNAPIIGLTGSQPQIDRVKKQYGIFAEPSVQPMAGKEMEHTAAVILFDRSGQVAGTIAPDQPDAEALAKLRKLVS